MSTIELSCTHCNVKFKYVVGGYNREIKKGRTSFYCSRSCACSARNIAKTPERKRQDAERLAKRNANNEYAKKGDFSGFLNKARNRNKDFNLTEEYLSSIWSGRCALSGIPIHRKRVYRDLMKLNTASLDRIDRNKGYVIGNVQFVAYGINLAKNVFSDEQLIEFLAIIIREQSFPTTTY